MPKKKTSAPAKSAAAKKKTKKEKIIPRKAKKKVKKVEKVEKVVEKKPEEAKPERFWEGLGRRKTAIARVRLFTRGEKAFLVNGKPFDFYFSTLELQQTAQAALEKMKCLDNFRVLAKVKGSGLHAQAEAIRHGISRALVKFNIDFQKRLRKVGYLTRDSRMRERKKFGLKRARRAPQWQKR
jgi:small subunit ribosomal protein S9